MKKFIKITALPLLLTIVMLACIGNDIITFNWMY